MIAVFAAMRFEVQRMLGRLEARRRDSVDGFPVALGELAGRPLLVCQTGIGRRAEEASRAVLGRCRPWAALSVGLAGALSPEYKVGDLVFGEWVYRADPGAPGGRGDHPVPSDQKLVEMARQAAGKQGLRCWTGSSLTTAHVVAEPGEKALLRRTSGLDMVEMESHWVGQVVRERRVPFLAVRVISDSVDDAVREIPGFVSAEGEQFRARLLPYMARRPLEIPRLLWTAAAVLRAVGNLTRFLEEFVRGFETSFVGSWRDGGEP